jgi:hypothetical protein
MTTCMTTLHVPVSLKANAPTRGLYRKLFHATIISAVSRNVPYHWHRQIPDSPIFCLYAVIWAAASTSVPHRIVMIATDADVKTYAK